MLTTLKQLIRNDDGATIVEYALIISLIAAACIATLTFLSGKIQTSLSNTANQLK